MKIGFSFYGILFGGGGRTGSDRDIRHCWPGLKRDLIDPFVAQGHEAKIYFSSYKPKLFSDECAFFDMVKPTRVNYSFLPSSDPFTAKYASFNNLMWEDIDVVIFTRCDAHWSKIMANENIDFTKFNFLFPEKGWWEDYNFTCDNFYVIPKKFLYDARRAMEDCYKWPRSQYVDTHGMWRCLRPYIGEENFHLISQEHEISDVNSFYTCCRNGLPVGEKRMEHLHPEVKERFNVEYK